MFKNTVPAFKQSDCYNGDTTIPCSVTQGSSITVIDGNLIIRGSIEKNVHIRIMACKTNRHFGDGNMVINGIRFNNLSTELDSYSVKIEGSVAENVIISTVGDVSIGGNVGNATEITTVSGNIRAKDVGSVKFKSESGNFFCNNIGSDAYLSTKSGDIQAADVNRNSCLKTISGNVQANNVAELVTLKSISGNIRTVNAHPASKLSTVSGSIARNGFTRTAPVRNIISIGGVNFGNVSSSNNFSFFGNSPSIIATNIISNPMHPALSFDDVYSRVNSLSNPTSSSSSSITSTNATPENPDVSGSTTARASTTTNAINTYSKPMQDYLKTFENIEKTNLEIFNALKLDTKEELLIDQNWYDPVTYNIINRPVVFNDNVFDLDTILNLKEDNDGQRKCPLTSYLFTLRDLQPARQVNNNIHLALINIKAQREASYSKMSISR